MSKKEIAYKICEPCKGNGYVRGSMGATGTCIYCNGSGHTNHGPRINPDTFIEIIKWVEDYIDGQQTEGWYH